MKKIFILLLIISNYFIAQSQNVGIGTLTPAGKLHIKGSADTSQLTIDANATQSNKHPLIRLRNSSGTDLLDIHSDDVTNAFIGVGAGKSNDAAVGALFNTFIGSGAGFSNTKGIFNTAIGSQSLYFNTVAVNNTAAGYAALYLNQTGTSNTAYGSGALYTNTTGSNNTANGYSSLAGNTTGNYNTANGNQSLISNKSGNNNTANGNSALYINTTGNFNTADGESALYHNTTGNFNTGVGRSALENTTTAFYNTAIGYNAGSRYDNGYNNVFLGANVDVNGPGNYNVIAIGQSTLCTASNQVTIGNPATSSYRAYTNWSNISDGRFKKNVRENVPGLDFITKLRPVTYNLDATRLEAFLHKNNKKGQPANNIAKYASYNEAQSNITANSIYNKAMKEKESLTCTGFVAQEVEAAAREIGFNFSGVDAAKDNNDVYSLRYAEFVVPLVKAVQEQQKIIEDLQKQIDELKALIKK